MNALERQPVAWTLHASPHPHPPLPTRQQGLLLFIRWVFGMWCQESKPALCREGRDACGASPLAGYPHLPRATPAGPEGAKCTSEWDLGTCFIGNPGPLDLSSLCIMVHKYIWNYLHKVSQNRCCSVSFGLRGVLATNEGVSSFGPSKGLGIASCLGPCQPSLHTATPSRPSSGVHPLASEVENLEATDIRALRGTFCTQSAAGCRRGSRPASEEVGGEAT